ncbi:MAG: transcription elongation factor GreA [Dehalococcoidia bacterium]|nr:transcription elongation factor GreA [Dehalococcoidia bacterium]
MAQKEVFLTPEGLEKLKAELEHLQSVRRPQVAEQIHRAKELGGTVDNAEYDDAKNEQAFIEGRILTIENMIKNARIIREEEATGIVTLGSKVQVRTAEGEEELYTIVGSAEASPSDGKISNESPVGSALMGKRVGDKVEVQAPAGPIKLTIVALK